MKSPGLRVISGAAAVEASPLSADAFQAGCVDAFVASWSARGFSPVTIENATGVLDRFLDVLGIPAWEAGPEDVDRVVADLVARGMAPSTRRGYVQAFKDFHRFLVARKAPEIEATFGVVLDDPVDEFNAARHVGNDGSPSTRPPPTPERMEDFFAFLRERVATARKFGSAGRDYALFRTLYHCGLRSDEAASLERSDLHFDRGPVLEEGGKAVSVGRAFRTVPERTRMVIEGRDRGCRVPGCDHSRWLHIHHIHHWEDGGRSDTSNLLALCQRHHRLHHLGCLGIRGDADDPDGVVFTDDRGRQLAANGRPIPPGDSIEMAAARLGVAPGAWMHPTGERLDPHAVHFDERAG